MDGSGKFLNRKEGVTQGYLLATIAYSIGILLFIREIRATHPHITLPWYVDDDSSGGEIVDLQDHM